MPTIRVHDSLQSIGAHAWDGLDPSDHPFLSFAFLEGLERHGCVRESLGWEPRHFALWEGARLLAAIPCYLKSNSHGEFVFDYAWAQAYERLGLPYYPKLLAAIPYSPIAGPRILRRADAPAATRETIASALVEHVGRARLSSVHANFLEPDDDATLEAAGWLGRGDWQFHWENRGWESFDAFVGALTSKRRKAIRQERQHLQRDGWRYVIRHGGDLTAAELDFAFMCYARTFAEKGNYPALTRAFFGHMAERMPAQLIVVFAERDAERAAAAVFLRGNTTLYGRYWGSTTYVPGLHFECCYYQGIEYCLAHGLSRFEPGAQGEHKLPRGFLPVRTRSRHWIADPVLRSAIARSLAGEADWLERYGRTLAEHSPYKEA